MLAKGIRVPIAKQTLNRSSKKMWRVFADLSRENELSVPGGKPYAIVFRDDYSHLFRRKSDGTSAVEQFLCDSHLDG